MSPFLFLLVPIGLGIHQVAKLVREQVRGIESAAERVGYESAVNSSIRTSVLGMLACGGIMLWGSGVVSSTNSSGSPAVLLIWAFLVLLPGLGIAMLFLRLLVSLWLKYVSDRS